MKNELIIFSMLLISFFADGQQQYFSKRYDYNSSVENGYKILPYDTGYIAWFTVTLNTADNRHQIAVVKIDTFGDTIFSRIIDIPNKSLFLGNPGAVCKTLDNGFAISGSIKDTLGNVNVLMSKY